MNTKNRLQRIKRIGISVTILATLLGGLAYAKPDWLPGVVKQADRQPAKLEVQHSAATAARS
ncbi:MAG: hypothetical protein NTX56_15345, partial [Proteobacteria bacterium]|nr:hypothetical protein [Pseudomonadota bacterium]